MDISLKNIYVSERLSKESTAFQAVLYIDDYRAAVIANYGQGGQTILHPRDEMGATLIREAKLWCRHLPPMVCSDSMVDGKPATIPMSLDIYLDDKIVDWLRQKDARKFRKKTEKEMLTAILFGEPGKTFRVMRYRLPIATLIGSSKGVDQLRKDIHRKVMPLLQENEMILNTNIPPETISLLAVPKGKWVEAVSGK